MREPESTNDTVRNLPQNACRSQITIVSPLNLKAGSLNARRDSFILRSCAACCWTIVVLAMICSRNSALARIFRWPAQERSSQHCKQAWREHPFENCRLLQMTHFAVVSDALVNPFGGRWASSIMLLSTMLRDGVDVWQRYSHQPVPFVRRFDLKLSPET